MEPGDEEPAGAEDWVRELESWAKGDYDESFDGGRGHAQFRNALRRRNLPRVGNSYRATRQYLLDWSIRQRVTARLGTGADDQDREYTPPECLGDDALQQRAASLGLTDLADEEFDRDTWVDAVIEAELRILNDLDDRDRNSEGDDGERPGDGRNPLERSDPSHPGGTLVRADIGRFRRGGAWHRRGQAAKVFDDDTAQRIEKLHILVADHTILSRSLWTGLTEEAEPTAVSAVFLGGVEWAEPGREQLGASYMELVTPYKDTALTEEADERLPIRQIKAATEAFAFYESSEGTERIFAMVSDDEPEGITVDMDHPASWPVIAVRPDGSSVFGPPSGGPGRQEGLLKNLMSQIGEGYQDADDDESARMLAKAVQSSLINAQRKGKKGHTLPELEELLGDGGREVSPLDRETVIPDRRNVSYRKRLLEQVGLTDWSLLDTPEGAVRLARSRKFCLRHNLAVIKQHFEHMEEAELLQAIRDGTLVMSPALLQRMDWADEGELFCSVCVGGKTGNTLLCGGPGSIHPCPGRDCDRIIITPEGSLVTACPKCPITFGFGTVKRADLKAQNESSYKELREIAVRQRFYYLLHHWGEDLRSKLVIAAGYSAAQIALAKHIIKPNVGAYKYFHQKGVRHLRYQLGAVFKMSGTGGLHGQDYQFLQVVPPLQGWSVERLLAELTKTDKSEPPRWGFKQKDSDESKNLIIEKAYTEAFNDVWKTHGDRAMHDPTQIWNAYEAVTAHDDNAEEWTPARRILLLQATLVDFSDRLEEQQGDWSRDLRFDHEKPGSIRLAMYLNGYNILHEVELPMEKGGRLRTAQQEFGRVPGCSDSPSSESSSKGLPLPLPMPLPKGHTDGPAGAGTNPNETPAATPTSAGKAEDAEVQDMEKRLEKMELLVSQQTEMLAKAQAEKKEAEVQLEASREKRRRARARARENKRNKEQAGEKEGKSTRAPALGPVVENLGLRGVSLRLSDRTTIEKPEEPAPSNRGELLQLRIGDSHSEAAWPKDVILDCCPCNASRVPFCPRAQSRMGCPRQHDTGAPCPLDHSLLPAEYWPPVYWEKFNGWGGHVSWNGELPLSKVLNLLTPEMACTILTLDTVEGRRDAALYHLETRLANLSKPGGEHIELDPIQNGAGAFLRSMWGPEAPHRCASPSGMPVWEWYRAVVGPADGFLSGTLMDLGDEVQIPKGRTIHNCCPFTSLGGLVTSHCNRSSIAEFSPSYRLAQQSFQQMASLPTQLLLDHPGSRLTELVVSCSELEASGLPDSWGLVCSPADIRHQHTLHACQGLKDPAEFVFRLGVTNSALRGEVWLTGRDAHKLEHWEFDTTENTRVLNQPVLTVWQCVPADAVRGIPTLHGTAVQADLVPRGHPVPGCTTEAREG